MKQPLDFPVSVELPVVWGEMDAFGHVNNIVYFRYFESARIEYFRQIGLIENMKETGVGPILAETSCKFIQSLQFPDTIIVSARIASMKESSFIMDYKILSKNSGEAASGMGRIVIFDYTEKIKTAVPKNIRDAIEKLEGKSF